VAAAPAFLAASLAAALVVAAAAAASSFGSGGAAEGGRVKMGNGIPLTLPVRLLAGLRAATDMDRARGFGDGAADAALTEAEGCNDRDGMDDVALSVWPPNCGELRTVAAVLSAVGENGEGSVI